MAKKFSAPIKGIATPQGEVCVRQKLGFQDKCEVCGKHGYVESYTFSNGGRRFSEDFPGMELTTYDYTGLRICSIDCFKKTVYFKAKTQGGAP